MRVRDIMSAPPVTASAEATIEELARLMLATHIGSVVIVDAQGGLAGLVTEADLAAKEAGVPFSLVRAPQVFGTWIGEDGIERAYDAARGLLARDVMDRDPLTADADDTIERAVQRMVRREADRVVAVRGREPVGILARHDLLRLLAPRTAARA